MEGCWVNATERSRRRLAIGDGNDHARIMSSVPTQFTGVTAVTKANLYFDARVVSHTLLFADGSKKTLGLIYPGTYHFGTGAPELMEIVAGACQVVLDGQTATASYAAGTAFSVPGQSGFTITVETGVCEYICSFLAT
jgi:uncharacterized protein YaiE (UPF0345 family)